MATLIFLAIGAYVFGHIFSITGPFVGAVIFFSFIAMMVFK